MKCGNTNTLRNFVQEKKRKLSLEHVVKLSLQKRQRDTVPLKRQRDTVPSKRQRLILSHQKDKVWYCRFTTITWDIVSSKRQLAILSVKQKHVILFVQNDNMWHYPVKTTTCDTIPSKRQLVILSLQNEIVWYCPFKTTTCDTVLSQRQCHVNLGIFPRTTVHCTVESEFEDQPEIIMLLFNSKITRIQLVVSCVRCDKIEYT